MKRFIIAALIGQEYQILAIRQTRCKCKFNVKHRECLCNHPSQRLMLKCLTIIQIELEFGNVGI